MRDLSLPAEQRSENTRGVEVQEKRRDIFLLKPSHRLGSFLSLWGSNRQHMVTQVIYHCHCPLPEKKPATQDVTINPERKATVQAPQAFNSQDLVCHGLLILLMEEIRLTCWHGYIYIYPIIYRVLYIPCGAGFLPSTSIFETLVDSKFAGPWVDEIPTMDSPFFDRRLLRIFNHKKQTDTRG